MNLKESNDVSFDLNVASLRGKHFRLGQISVQTQELEEISEAVLNVVAGLR